MTERIVHRAKSYESDTVPGDYATLETPCPKCGGEVRENYRRFACTKCDFSLSKNPGSRSFEIPEVEQLLRERTLGPLQGFRSKMGRPFAAILKLSAENKLEFDFGQGAGGDGDGDGEVPDFSGRQPLGACPKCGGGVHEHGLSYVCERSVGPEKSCDFRSGKIILQQEVSNEQMAKLLAEGRTDLLPGFVSSRTKRKFKAFLVRDPAGKIGFEFEPRPERPARAGAAAGRTAAKTQAEAPAAAAPTRARRATSAATADAGASDAAAKPAAKRPAARRSASSADKPAPARATARKPAGKA